MGLGVKTLILILIVIFFIVNKPHPHGSRICTSLGQPQILINNILVGGEGIFFVGVRVHYSLGMVWGWG